MACGETMRTRGDRGTTIFRHRPSTPSAHPGAIHLLLRGHTHTICIYIYVYICIFI